LRNLFRLFRLWVRLEGLLGVCNRQEGPGNDKMQQAAAYQRLRALAAEYLRRQRPGHTLQPTALVHEAYARLLRSGRFENMAPGPFMVVAARAMRSVLIDHARKRTALKRGGPSHREPLDDVVDLYEQSAVDLIALDDALSRLARIDAEQVRVIELRFFGGLTEEETAETLGISARTVGRVWRRARAWLRREMGEASDDVE